MKIRNTYILLVTIIGLFTLALYSTFAMFTANFDTNEFVSISASNLPTDTSMLEYERLTIEAGDSKIIDLNISNKTTNNLYYGAWYEMIEPSTKNDNIVIAKYVNSSNETFGSIASSVSNKVTIIVNNKTSDSITINIGVAYSNTNSLNLPLNRELVTGEYGNFNVSISASNATIEGGYFEGGLSLRSDVVKSGNSITYTVRPNAGYKLDKVTCDNGINARVDGNAVIVNNVISDTRCIISVVSSIRTSDEMLKYLGLTAKTGTPDFSKTATTDEGVYDTNDDYGTSYYFRGASTKNYVKFANKWWRIIRINGDGTIRMIYDGTTAHNNGESSTDRQIGTSAFNTDKDYNAYVGYMYGTPGSWLYDNEHANQKNSTIKRAVDNWYKVNIVDAGFDEKVADVVYCNDRTVTKDFGYTGNGISRNETSYGRYALNLLKSPILTCSQKNDAFTVNDTIKGNGALTYPVGLLTADEASVAGAVAYSGNNKYYLYMGKSYWLMSPDYFNGSYAYVFIVAQDGSLNYDRIDTSLYIRPVISLRNDIQLKGTGTMFDPFEVQ